MHEDAKNKLKEQQVDLRRNKSSDGEEEPAPAKPNNLDGLRRNLRDWPS
ncbi:MAG: hypothetical protein OSB69_17380 [Alphaproteobacteria bacterium]|nr:hypothetical protein [Alphaproteobacteria bacterium]